MTEQEDREDREQKEDEGEEILAELTATQKGKTKTYSEEVLIKRIRAGVLNTLKGIIQTGRWLNQARDQEPWSSMTTEQWDQWLRDKVSMNKGTASKFMTIFRNSALVDEGNFDALPPHYPTLYSLARIDAADLQQMINDGRVTPAISGADRVPAK